MKGSVREGRAHPEDARATDLSPAPTAQAPEGDPHPEDRLWMARAMEVARVAAQRGEVPVGAVLVRDGRLLAEAHNRTILFSDPTAHAEVLAIRRATRAQGDWRLPGTVLYTTLEPCPLCAGAILLARIPRVVYSAPDLRFGMAGTLENLLQDPRINHRAELASGVLAESSAALLRTFFRRRRTPDDAPSSPDVRPDR